MSEKKSEKVTESFHICVTSQRPIPIQESADMRALTTLYTKTRPQDSDEGGSNPGSAYGEGDDQIRVSLIWTVSFIICGLRKEQHMSNRRHFCSMSRDLNPGH